MQKCLLLEMLANAKLKVDDISTDVKYKRKDDDWWQAKGIKLVSRIKKSFGPSHGPSDTCHASELHGSALSSALVLYFGPNMLTRKRPGMPQRSTTPSR